ncbi:sensor histidine kinase [Microvirga sp. ACRRW]|uniref:sensor histidine kinase n=1 Tax=Microvirga sp. ACRRW TaxID=2918205 RepID=UPI001EF606F4|nr:sensor histidine kinase [Microvirga sp. ACRRW]MCG7394812.1 sensor histidine kinase [Microvirga sp. ACRRW]
MSPKRGISLIGQFLLIAFAVMIVGMLAMGVWVSWQVRENITGVKAASIALSINNFVAPHLQELAFGDVLSEAQIRDLNRTMERPDFRASITSLRIWKPGGLIVYSSERNLIGKRFPRNPNPQKAWAGSITVVFDGLAYEEDAGERAMNIPLLEVFAPVYEAETGIVIAVVEFHERADTLEAELDESEWQTWIATALITLNMMGCLFVIVANAGKIIDRQRAALTERVAQLSALLQQNRILQERIERAAQNATEDNERFMRRMAYDLHDGIAQLIGLALLRLDRVRSNPHDHENLKTIQKVLSDALNDTRNICKGLLLPEVDKLSLKEALTFMIRQHERQTGMAIKCNISNLPEQAPQFVKIALCRFLQEGLNNAFKHAGGQGLGVDIAWDGLAITIEVTDKGPGMCNRDESIREHGLGLSGLRDRIESIGGIVSITSQPGFGTSIKASLPLALGEANAA